LKVRKEKPNKKKSELTFIAGCILHFSGKHNKDDLKTHFSKYGKVKFVDTGRDEVKPGEESAYVRFEDAAFAKAALEDKTPEYQPIALLEGDEEKKLLSNACF